MGDQSNVTTSGVVGPNSYEIVGSGAMPDRPKPPKGYETWLDALVGAKTTESGIYVVPARWQALAAQELEELRAERALFKAMATCNCPDCMTKRRELKAAAAKAVESDARTPIGECGHCGKPGDWD